MAVSNRGIKTSARLFQKRERSAGDISRKVFASQGNFIRPIGAHIREMIDRRIIKAVMAFLPPQSDISFDSS
jgi:hypothetical protein